MALVIPEINPQDALNAKGIIASPNCSTTQLVVAIKPLHDAARVKRVVVSTYQAVSGAGLAGTSELDEQVRKVGDHAPALAMSGTAVDLPAPNKFPEPIAYNVIPLGGSLVDRRRFLGRRRLLRSLDDSVSLDDRRRLQMRHRLRTSRVCYSFTSRLRVMPQAFVVALIELIHSVVVGRFRQAADVVSAR